MKKIWTIVAGISVLVGTLFCSSICVNAKTQGYYEYTVTNGKATITDVDSSIIGNITIPSKLGGYPVTTIDYQAFDSCRMLTGVTFPEGIETIGTCSFFDCENLLTVAISDSVKTIGPEAFSGCTSLTNLILGSGVDSIGNYAFDDCVSLENVFISDLKAWCNIEFDVRSSNPLFYGAGLYLNNKLITKLTIPDGVTEIKPYAFYGYAYLTSATIPYGVQTIGREAFCVSGLTSVTIPESVTTIGIDAFSNCKFKSVTIPDGVQTIGSSAFINCRELESVTIGNDVVLIDNYAFKWCDNLKSVKIGNSVIMIGEQAFQGCNYLEGIIIPDSVITIGNNAFAGCYSLTTITIPDSVKTIGSEAFLSCFNLKSVIMADSVRKIGSNAFDGCSDLTDIYYTGTEAKWNSIEINCYIRATIHYDYVIPTGFPVVIKSIEPTFINQYLLVKTKVANITHDEIAYIVSYDVTGRVDTVEEMTFTNNENQTVLPAADIEKVKVFIWDEDGITPLAEAMECVL